MIATRAATGALAASAMAFVCPQIAHAQNASNATDMQTTWSDTVSAAWERAARTYSAPGDEDSKPSGRAGGSIERGLSDFLSLGLGLGFDKVGLDRNSATSLAFDDVTLRTRLELVGSERAGSGIDLQAGLIIAGQSSLARPESFVRAEAHASIGEFTGNLRLASEPANGNQWEIQYGLRTDRALGTHVRLGLKSEGRIDALRPPQHRLGAQLEFQPEGTRNGPAIALSTTAGLTQAAPGMQVKTNLAWKF